MEIGRWMELCWGGVSSVFCYLLSATLAILLALVGGALGAIIGSVIGIRSDTFLRGAAMGAIAGGLLSIEMFRILLAFCLPDDGTFCRIFPVFDSPTSRATRRLVRDLCTPIAMADDGDLIGPNIEGHNQALKIPAKKIPSKRMTMKDLRDSSGKRISCSVCLQDFKFWQMARIPPCCRQAFHRRCIDKWLLRHNSCPLCRSNILE